MNDLCKTNTLGIDFIARKDKANKKTGLSFCLNYSKW